MARLVGSKVASNTGQPVVIENRPGAGGQIAAAALMQAERDGYTLLIGDIGVLAINATLYTSLSFHPEKDFAPITNLASMPLVLLVPASSRARSVAELVALGKTTASGINYASQGPGTGGHIVGELFKRETGVNFIHVPYKGSAPAIADVISGRCDFIFDLTMVARPNVAAGKLAALAIASDHRSPFLQGVPTMAELGYPGVAMDVWFGLVGRAGTPAGVIDKLNTEFVKAVEDPELAKRFTDLTVVPQPMKPDKFAAFMKEEAARWGAVVKERGIHVD